MKIIDHIQKKGNQPLFSFEILPPLKGQHIRSLFETIDNLIEFHPSFINVTYHREEYKYKDMGDGLLKKLIIKKRPGTVGICAAIQSKYDVDAVPHVLCGGFTKEDTENLLIDLDFLGIDNVMALRGDPIKSETYFKPEENGHTYAKDLVRQINDLNQGIYLDEELQNKTPTKFCVGVAGYPEKHLESPSLDSDIYFLKKKIAAGAKYIVTQLFYDNQKYFEFVKKCRSADIAVPIIPGLKPIATKRQLSMIPQRFFVDLPKELIDEVVHCKDNRAVRQLGIEWCIAQSKELKEHGVDVLHYYSMGKSDNIRTIVKAVF